MLLSNITILILVLSSLYTAAAPEYRQPVQQAQPTTNSLYRAHSLLPDNIESNNIQAQSAAQEVENNQGILKAKCGNIIITTYLIPYRPDFQDYKTIFDESIKQEYLSLGIALHLIAHNSDYAGIPIFLQSSHDNTVTLHLLATKARDLLREAHDGYIEDYNINSKINIIIKTLIHPLLLYFITNVDDNITTSMVDHYFNKLTIVQQGEMIALMTRQACDFGIGQRLFHTEWFIEKGFYLLQALPDSERLLLQQFFATMYDVHPMDFMSGTARKPTPLAACATVDDEVVVYHQRLPRGVIHQWADGIYDPIYHKIYREFVLSRINIILELDQPLTHQYIPRNLAPSITLLLTNNDHINTQVLGELQIMPFIKRLTLEIPPCKRLSLIDLIPILQTKFPALISCAFIISDHYNKHLTNDVIVKLVEHYTGLTSLHIDNSNITDDAIISIAHHCPNLTSLNVGGCNITDDAIKAIAHHCPKLTSLNVSDCKITDDAITANAHYCPNLTLLNVSHKDNICEGGNLAGCTISDAAIEAIAQHCPSLTSLDVSGLDISDDAIKAIAHYCPHLTSLELQNCFEITDDAIKAIAHHCPDLTALNVIGCTISHAAIIDCPNLTLLKVSHCCLISDLEITAIAKNCPNLTSLQVSRCRITNAAIIQIAGHCPKLTSLQARCCININDSAIRAIEANCPNLTLLDVQGCRRITFATLKNLQKKLPELRIIQ